MAFFSKLFGKNKNQEEKTTQPIQQEKEINDLDDQSPLTEEEIKAAEKLEEQLKQETLTSQTLDYDGEFIETDEDLEGDTQAQPDPKEIPEIKETPEVTEVPQTSPEVTETPEITEVPQTPKVVETPEITEVPQTPEIVETPEVTEVPQTLDTQAPQEEQEEKISFWKKLKSGLSKTRNALFAPVEDLLKNFVKVDEDLLEELEELLIMADIGVYATGEIIEQLRERIKDGRLKEKDQVMSSLQEILTDMIGEHEPLKLETTPSVVLVIGVNGAGKTTSIGKISKRLRLSGKNVVVAAADTFRAAAIEQLEVWCERAQVDIVKQNEGSDPAAVVFDAISYAKRKRADVLIIDTAGRLHNKTNLMNELAKINRVIDRELPGASRENLLVLDATTGQNAVVQAKEFSKTANITGITLNKLDGSAKGGIVISIKQELGIPVKFIGVGEKIDDMQEFSSEDFVKALFE